MNDEELQTITLTDEEGKEHEFVVVDILNVEDKDYVILQPNTDEPEEGIILRIDQDDDGNDVLVEIESDDEFQKVVDVWEDLTYQAEEEDE